MSNYITFQDNINSTIGNNVAGYTGMSNVRGGGIYAEETVFTMFNSTVSENSATYHGGGIYAAYDADVYIYNSTIANNTGGGIMVYYYGSAYLENTILWNNGVGHSATANPISGYYSNIPNLYGGGTGVVDVNPNFVDPDNGDFTLQSNSPLIDAGTPDQEMTALPGLQIQMTRTRTAPGWIWGPTIFTRLILHQT